MGFYKDYLFIRMIGLPFGLINIVFLGWFLEFKNKICYDTAFYNKFYKYYFSIYLRIS